MDGEELAFLAWRCVKGKLFFWFMIWLMDYYRCVMGMKRIRYNWMLGLATLIHNDLGGFMTIFIMMIDVESDWSSDWLDVVIERPAICRGHSTEYLGLLRYVVKYEAVYDRKIAIPDETAISFDEEQCGRIYSNDASRYGTQNALIAMMLATMALGGYIGGSSVACMVLCFLAMTIFTGKPTDTTGDLTKTGEAFPGPDGHYKIIGQWMGYRWHVGVGYAHRGALISKKHVTGGHDISYGGRNVRTSYVSGSSDVQAWGSIPVIETPEDGEVVAVTNYNPYNDCWTVHKTYVHRDGDAYRLATCRTLPGSSGSAFFVSRRVRMYGKNEREAWLYAGATGRAMISLASENLQVEYGVVDKSLTSPRETPIRLGYVDQVIEHPGKGKTMGAILRYVEEATRMGLKVIVAGPTRVVAMEQLRALEGRCEGVACAIKGTKTRRHWKVLVTTHPTALQLHMRGDMPRKALWIIDESHFEQATTQILVTAIRQAVVSGKDMALVEMSATMQDARTGETIISRGSNYHIEDVVVEGGVKDLIAEAEKVRKDNPDARIVVFCDTVTGEDGVMKTAERLKIGGVPVVTLHRANFSAVYPRLGEDEAITIVTTSISECGANFNADYVFDTGKRVAFTVVANGGMIAIDKSSAYITEAQRIQRRGRVGRRKEGFYYTTRAALEASPGALRDPASAEVFDECLLCDAMGLEMPERADVIDKAMTKIRLSGAQAIKWLQFSEDNNVSALYIWASTDRGGNSINYEERQMKLKRVGLTEVKDSRDGVGVSRRGALSREYPRTIHGMDVPADSWLGKLAGGIRRAFREE